MRWDTGRNKRVHVDVEAQAALEHPSLSGVNDLASSLPFNPISLVGALVPMIKPERACVHAVEGMVMNGMIGDCSALKQAPSCCPI